MEILSYIWPLYIFSLQGDGVGWRLFLNIYSREIKNVNLHKEICSGGSKFFFCAD